MVRRELRMCMLRKREPLPSKLLFLTKAYVPMLHVLSLETGVDMAFLPGAGAAGGVAGGLMPFLNGELKSGIEIILDLLH